MIAKGADINGFLVKRIDPNSALIASLPIGTRTGSQAKSTRLLIRNGANASITKL